MSALRSAARPLSDKGLRSSVELVCITRQVHEFSGDRRLHASRSWRPQFGAVPDLRAAVQAVG